MAFDWRLLELETACVQAASFAATTALEASSARVVFARMPPPDECRHPDNPTTPSGPFPGSVPLPIAACPAPGTVGRPSAIPRSSETVDGRVALSREAPASDAESVYGLQSPAPPWEGELNTPVMDTGTAHLMVSPDSLSDPSNLIVRLLPARRHNDPPTT